MLQNVKQNFTLIVVINGSWPLVTNFLKTRVSRSPRKYGRKQLGGGGVQLLN